MYQTGGLTNITRIGLTVLGGLFDYGSFTWVVNNWFRSPNLLVLHFYEPYCWLVTEITWVTFKVLLPHQIQPHIFMEMDIMDFGLITSKLLVNIYFSFKVD